MDRGTDMRPFYQQVWLFYCAPRHLSTANIRNFLILLCCCCTELPVAEGPEEPFPLDRLSPYKEGFHGSGRSRRAIAQQLHVKWNRRTYEEYHLKPFVPEAAELQYEMYRYEDTVESELGRYLSIHRRRYLLGSIAYVENPYYTFSVLEPFKPGGCEMKYNRAIKSAVSATSHQRKYGCKLATNAGYFSVASGECLGNVVSDGRLVQTTSDQNANFGIRNDGTIVVGYVPEEDVLNRSYRQLITGVIWLVRNGTNYVNESMELECSNHQDTGAMSTFVNVLSARTAIGHDSGGRIVVANIEGQTHKRGANLYEFADLLIAHGVINAINLDGGGSSTFIKDQVLINYPSDHCHADPAYRCEREVSTAVCFHDVQCLEPSCYDHGTCVRGECKCNSPWVGMTCDELNCSLTNCSGHGNCSNGTCTCDPGWNGDECNEGCSPGSYGPGCTSKCWCYGKSICNPVTGTCSCPSGYTGFGCWKECTDGFYGLGCLQRCPLHNCSGNGKCSPVDGTCLCSANWTGSSCNQTIHDQGLSSSWGTVATGDKPLLSSSLQFLSTNSDGISIFPSSFNSKPVGCSSISPSGVHSKSINDGCSEVCKLDPSTQGNKYGLAILVFCMIMIASVLVHVFICMKFERENRVAFIRVRTKQERRDIISD